VSKRREGRLSGSFALESPEKIRGIEEMDEDLSFQFEDGELQREEEKEEEEAEEQRDEEEAEEQREEEEAEEQRKEEEDVDEQREEDEKPAHRPLKPSLPSQQGFTCSSCLSRNHFTAYPFCVCCGYKVL
jgi:outer membrane biosynthesis protein TonB